MMQRSAEFSPCRQYRYALWRQWGVSPQTPKPSYAMFVGLNPSTADELNDDPTIRRCIAFAKAWGYAGLCMANLFAFRATDPRQMKAQPDPVGPDNNETLLRLAREAGIVVAAWGEHGIYRGRSGEIQALLPALHYLRLTKAGNPGHPLYLPSTLVPIPFETRPR